MKISWLLTLLLLTALIISCARDPKVESSDLVKQPITQPTPQVWDEPVQLQGIGTSSLPENIRQTWANFTRDGRYRLARPDDMRFPKDNKNKYPWEYIWGDLNFDKRIEDDHLAAVIVDTTQNGPDKFSLVIFSPIKNTTDKYAVNWLYRDEDLSNVTVSRASGELYVRRYYDDSEKACSVRWNKKLRQFECPI